MNYPTKSQTSYTHKYGSFFLLFLQQAIQKIFIFVFTLQNLLNGCEFRCECCNDILSTFAWPRKGSQALV